VRQLGVSDVNMEEGSLRVDANVSVRPAGSSELGTKTELKNMNSFRFLQRGIEAELERQRQLVASGGTVEQETLHFDPTSGSLTSLRSKEEAHDYRYFPEPDLVPLAPTEEMLREAHESLPELPEARAARYEGEGLSADAARFLAGEPETADFFDQVAAKASAGPQVVANWVTGDLAAALRAHEDGTRPTVAQLADLVDRVDAKKISHGNGRSALTWAVENGEPPATYIEREELEGGGDADELAGVVAAAIAADPAAAEQIKAGNGKAIGAIVGAVMRETKGRADGGEVNRLIREQLGL
jgi:aspartyl-tRNA(Asn)/glutamyl-tRNA(Gln) amidotransferase subunit B